MTSLSTSPLGRATLVAGLCTALLATPSRAQDAQPPVAERRREARRPLPALPRRLQRLPRRSVVSSGCRPRRSGRRPICAASTVHRSGYRRVCTVCSGRTTARPASASQATSRSTIRTKGSPGVVQRSGRSRTDPGCPPCPARDAHLHPRQPVRPGSS